MDLVPIDASDPAAPSAFSSEPKLWLATHPELLPHPSATGGSLQSERGSAGCYSCPRTVWIAAGHQNLERQLRILEKLKPLSGVLESRYFGQDRPKEASLQPRTGR